MKALTLIAVSILAIPQAFAAKSSSDVREQLKPRIQRLAKDSVKMMTDSQEVVVESLSQYATALTTCELALAPVSGRQAKALAAIDEAPAWLIQAAREAFIENVDLDAATLQTLKEHAFLTEVAYSIQSDAKIEESQLRKQIQRALIDSVPLQNETGSKLVVQIAKLQYLPGENTVSFKLKIQYDNGETRMLQVRKIGIGSVKIETRVAQFVVAAIHHRRILSEESALRQEMNAVRYNIMKLIQMVPANTAQRLNQIAEAIEKNQPESGMLTGFFNGNTWFRGTDTVMGQAFATLISAKEELIEMAQRAKEAELKAARAAGRKADTGVVFIPNAKSAERGRTASGYYVQRPAPQRIQRSSPQQRRRDDDDNDTSMTTMIWIMDPGFMLSHPWYWGNRNGTFWSHWMMYDWISDRSRRSAEEALARHNREHHHHQESPFYPSQPYSERQMARFDSPVDPSPHEIRELGGRVADEPKPRVEQSDDLSQAWSRVTGEAATPSAPAQPEVRSMDTAESERFSSGRDASEWGSKKEEAGSDEFKTVGRMEDPAPRERESQRDSSIKGY